MSTDFISIYPYRITALLEVDVASCKPLMDITDFTDLVSKYPAILYPASELRDALRGRVAGEKFWQKYDEYRLKISYGKYFDVKTIVETRGRPDPLSAMADGPGRTEDDEEFVSP
jgi:hypothetical protein